MEIIYRVLVFWRVEWEILRSLQYPIEMSDPAYCNYMFVNNDQEFYFSYTLVNESTIFQVVLDVSGVGTRCLQRARNECRRVRGHRGENEHEDNLTR
jgi:Holliday junction resolvasome RuvABC DNA-binding subunit